MGVSTKRKLACFLPRIFEPRGTNELLRLGSDSKGGHVVAADAVASTSGLLSLGLSPNFEFEIDFAAMARLKRLHGYDPAISEIALRRARRRALFPFQGSRMDRHRALVLYRDYKTLFIDRRPNFVHFPKAVGPGDNAVTLDEALSTLDTEPGKTYLKCDIGGDEHGMLDAIIENNEALSGIALVLHDVPARMREIQVFLTAMMQFMFLDNMVADNAAGMNDENVPLGLALSMSSKFRTEPHIPIAGATTRYKLLNEPNDPNKIDLEIVYVD